MVAGDRAPLRSGAILGYDGKSPMTARKKPGRAPAGVPAASSRARLSEWVLLLAPGCAAAVFLAFGGKLVPEALRGPAGPMTLIYGGLMAFLAAGCTRRAGRKHLALAAAVQALGYLLALAVYAIGGSPPDPHSAVGWASFTGYPKSQDHACTLVLLAAAVGLAALAARLLPLPAKPAGPQPPPPRPPIPAPPARPRGAGAAPPATPG
jgi:hypothetical protein